MCSQINIFSCLLHPLRSLDVLLLFCSGLKRSRSEGLQSRRAGGGGGGGGGGRRRGGRVRGGKGGKKLRGCNTVAVEDFPEVHGEEIKDEKAFWLDANGHRRCYYRCKVPGCQNNNFHQSILECEQCQYVMGIAGGMIRLFHHFGVVTTCPDTDCNFDCDAETEKYIKRCFLA